MNLIYFAAFVAACSAAKLDRTYLPPPSAAFAGGSPGSLQAPFTRTIDQVSQNVPPGGFINEHQGIVVDAAAAGTRASNPQSGLGGSRTSYGSTDSKVGDAAFRVTSSNQFAPGSPNFGFGAQGADFNPDLSAFHKPISSSKPANIQIIRDYVSNTVKYQNDIGLDKFNYAFETENGIKAAENGVAINGVQAHGGFSYIGDDGNVYSVSYTADEGGFRPQGNHLPTPPPIPQEILKSLEQNAKDEAAGLVDDGSYDAQKYNEDDDYTKSDANGKYNDRQSNKFGDRPGSDDSNGAFINQNQQAFVTPNFNGQFGFTNDASKDKTTKPDSSKFGAIGYDKINNKNTLPSGQINQFGNIGIGSRNEYLPPRDQSGNIQESNASPGIFSSGGSGSPAQPLSQQKLQTQGSFGKPQSTFVRPSSYDTSPGISQGSIIPQISSIPSSGLNTPRPGGSFGIGGFNTPSTTSQSYNNPSQQNPGSNTSSNQKPIINQQNAFGQSPLQSSFPQSTQFSQQFLSTNSPLQSTQNLNGRLPTTPFGTISSESFNPSNLGQTQYTNKPSSSFGTTFSSGVPTKQPQSILTASTNSNKSPISFDTGKTEPSGATIVPDSTNTNGQSSQFSIQSGQNKENSPTQSTTILSGNTFSGFNTSPFGTSPQTTSQNFGNTQTNQLLTNNNPQTAQTLFTSNRPSDTAFVSNTQRPNYTPFNQFSGQPQGADHSYVYNRPLTPFNTPFTQSQSNKFPSGSLLNNFDKVTQTITTPQDSTFTTQFQSQSQGLNNNPSLPTTTIFSSPTSLKDNERNKNIFQSSNGITQASISPFPSIVPTVSSNFKQPSSQFGLKPLQQTQFNIPSQSAFSQATPTSATASAQVVSSLPDNKKYTTQIQIGQRPSSEDEKTSNDIDKVKPTQQYNNEIYEYNKPTQGLSSETQKESEAELSPKTEKPQFVAPSTQFSQEISTTTSEGQNKDQIGQEKPQTIFGSQTNLPKEQQSFPSLTQKVNNLQPTQQEQHALFGAQLNSQFSQPSTHLSEQSGKQTVQFGIQPTTSYNQGSFDTKKNTFSSSQQPGTQPSVQSSDGKPSKFFPSTIPSNIQKQETQTFTTSPQKPTFGFQSNTQFGSSDTKKTTPTYFHQPNQQPLTQLNSKPSTSIPSISETKPGISGEVSQSYSSQKPTNTPSSFGIQPNTQFGQVSFDNKATTIPQFQLSTNQQPTTQFSSKPSTSIQSLPQTSTNLFNTQNPDQQFTYSTSFAQPTNEPEFGTQFNTQEGDSDNKGTTISQFQNPTQQFTTSFDKQPTSIPSTTQIQDLVENTQFGEIYDYKKPVQSFVTPSQKENNGELSHVNPQFEAQSNTQFGQQPTSQKEKPTRLGQQSQFNLQPNAQYNKANEKESTVSQFTETEPITDTEYNTGSTLVPSTPQDQSSFNTQEPDQISTTGEIYEYTKPEQGLTSQSQKENSQFGQRIKEQQNGAQFTSPGQSNFGSKQPITLQPTQIPTGNSGISQTQAKPDSQRPDTLTTQSAFTPGVQSTKPFDSRPQFTLQSACCQGSKANNNRGTAPVTQGTNGLNSNLGTSVLDQNKIIDQNKKPEGTQGPNLPGNQDFGPQRGSQTYAGVGEQFGGPRKPPSFDESGYHY